jgi:hypothetical protein
MNASKRFVVIVALACLSALSGSAQNESKLSILLRAEQDTYSLRSDIRLVIVRENQGQQDLIVPRQWGWGVRRTHIRVF